MLIIDYEREYTVIFLTFDLDVNFDFIWNLTKRYPDL